MRVYSTLRVGVMVLLLTSAGNAKDLAIPKCDCQITIPDAWSPSPRGAPEGSYLTAASNAGNTQGTSLYVATIGDTADAQANYIKNTEQGIGVGHNYTILSREHKQIGNFDFYVVDGTQPARGGGTMHWSLWFTFTNKQVFQIDLYSQNTDPVTDPALLAVAQSFKITRTN
jgi:hypothetical protein